MVRRKGNIGGHSVRYTRQRIMSKKKTHLEQLTSAARHRQTRLKINRPSQRPLKAHLVKRNTSPLQVTSSSSHTSSATEGGEINAPGEISARIPEVEVKTVNEVKGKGIRTRLSTGTLEMAGTSTFSLSPAIGKISNSPDSIASRSSTQGMSSTSGKDQPPENRKDSLKRKCPVDQSEDKDIPSVPPKRKKIGRNDGSGEDNKNDYFCWLCHKEGQLICCELCPRVFHVKCLNSTQNIDQDWVCPECEKIMQAECTDTRSEAMSRISIDMLCTLLRYALDRMKAVGASTFEKPVNPTLFPNYSDYVFHPMCLSQLEKNIRRKQYGSTEAFLSDAKWIVHNSIVYNGSQSDITSAAKSLLKVSKHELNEIEVCLDCYMNSCVQSHQEWFCEPCSKPHAIVWAKLKGSPFWPAKVLREVNGHVDLRFFGAHDRSWVPISSCFMLSKESPSLVKKGRSGMDMAMKEVKIHIERLRERFGNFEYAAHRTTYTATHILNQLNPNAPKASIQKATRKEQTSKTSLNVPVSKPQAIAPKPSPSMAPVIKTSFKTSSLPSKVSAMSGKELVTKSGSLSTNVNARVVMTRLSLSTTAPSVITTPSGSGQQLKRQVFYLKPMQKGVFMLSQPSSQQLAHNKAITADVPRPSVPDPQLPQRIVTKICPQASNILIKSPSSSQDVTSSTSATESVSSFTVSSSASSIIRNDNSPVSSSSESQKPSAPMKSTTAKIQATSCSKLMPSTSTLDLGKSPPPLILRVSPVTPKPDCVKSALPSSDSSVSLSQNQKKVNPENAEKAELERATEKCDIERVGGETISERVNVNQDGTEMAHHSQMVESSLTSSLEKISRPSDEHSNSSKPILRGILSEANSISTSNSSHLLTCSQGNHAKDPASQNSKSVAEKESSSNGEEVRLPYLEKQSSPQLIVPDTDLTSCRRESSEKVHGKTPEIPPQKLSALSVTLPSATTSETAVHQSGLSHGANYKSSLQRVIDSCKAKLGIGDEDVKALEKEEDNDDDLLAESDSDELHLCLDDDYDNEEDEEENNGIGAEENLSDKKQASEKSNESQSSNSDNIIDLSDISETRKTSKMATEHQTEGIETEDRLSKNTKTADLFKPVEGLENSCRINTYKRLEVSVSESSSVMPQKIQTSQYVDQDSERGETSNFKTSEKEDEISLEGPDPENRTSYFQTSDDIEMLDSVSQSKDRHVSEIADEQAKKASECQKKISDTVAKASDNQSDLLSGIQSSEKSSVPMSILKEMPYSVLGAKEDILSKDGSQTDCNTEPGSTSEDKVPNQFATVAESVVDGTSVTSTQMIPYVACQTKETDKKQTESLSVKPSNEETGRFSDLHKDQKNDYDDNDIDLDMEVVCEEDDIPGDNTDDNEADDIETEKVSEEDKNREHGNSPSRQTTEVTKLSGIASIATKESTASTLHPSSKSSLSSTATSSSAKSKPLVSSAKENDMEVTGVSAPSSISVPGRALHTKSRDNSPLLAQSSSTEHLTHVVHGSSTSSSPSLKDQDVFISLVDDMEVGNDNLVGSVNDDEDDDDDNDESCIMVQTQEPCIDVDAIEEEATVETAKDPGSECSSGRSLVQQLDPLKDNSSQLETSLDTLFQSSTSKITAWLSAHFNELKANAKEMLSNQKKSSAVTVGDMASTGSDEALEKMKKEVEILEQKLIDWQSYYVFISLVDDMEVGNDNLVGSVNDDEDDDDDNDESCIMVQTQEPCIDVDAIEEEATVETAKDPGSECSSGRSLVQLLDPLKDNSSQLETSLDTLFQSSTSKITAWLSAHFNELKANAKEMLSNQKKSSAVTVGDMASAGSDMALEKMKKEVEKLEQKLIDWQSYYEHTVEELKETYLQERQAGLRMCQKMADQHLQNELSRTKKQMEEKHACELKNAVSETKRKQWCSECCKEAVYYCCWNTSYCSCQCQQKHWPSHLPTCMQAQQHQSPDTTSVAGSASNIISRGKNVTIIKPAIASSNPVGGNFVKCISAPRMSLSKVSVVPAALWHMAGGDEVEGKRSIASVPPSVPSTVPRPSPCNANLSFPLPKPSSKSSSNI